MQRRPNARHAKPSIPFLPRSVCLIAGDISPIDVITPLPVLCEDNDIPYIYVPRYLPSSTAGTAVRWGTGRALSAPHASVHLATSPHAHRPLCARSKEELGAAGLTKRPTSCMLLLPRPQKGAAKEDDEAKEFAEAYAEVRGG